MEYRISEDEAPAKRIDLMNLSPPSNDIASKLSNYKRVHEKVKKSLKGAKPGSHSSKMPEGLDRFMEDKTDDEPDRYERSKTNRQSVLVHSSSHAYALNDSEATDRHTSLYKDPVKTRYEVLQSELQ